MRTHPIRPARIRFDDGVPFAPEFGDIYHARAGALEQARHVFLGGNGLPARWAGRERFVVLETGFGLGNNFLATWAAWREDPRRPSRLVFVSVEKHPPVSADLARAHAASPLAALARELVAAWPPLVPTLHGLEFDHGAVTLLLALGDAAQWLRELVLRADAIYLDGFAPAKNPAMWDRRALETLGRLAAPGATAATWSVARELRDGLAAAGFAVERAAGFAGKREMTVARFAPRFVAPAPPGRMPAPSARDALVIGAGLAGAGVAAALARHGVPSLVLDADAPAAGASGNAGGLFHGTVHGDDGVHARFHRAAALAAARELTPAIARGELPGAVTGLLRLETALDLSAMRERLHRLGLPQEYVAAVDAAAAAERCALPLAQPAWWYPAGGWVDPAALVRRWLAAPGVTWRGHAAVHALRERGGRWQALDAGGSVLGEADVVVVAAAHDAPHLLGNPQWPLGSVRGQVTRAPAGSVPAPRTPVAGAGYALALPGGAVLCGATSQHDDPCPSLRDADHLHNLDRLRHLTGVSVDPSLVDGRVGWRLVASDRLPLAGPVATGGGARVDPPRLAPRVPGLYVFTALASRGIAWSPLAARVIAASITGAPQPLEASLLDAIDPARFAARAIRTPAS